MVMVIYFGNVPFLLLISVKIPSFMISFEWIRDIDLVVYSGMVFLVFLVSMVPSLGLLMLLIVPVFWLNLRLAGILLVFLLRGVLLLILMLLRLPQVIDVPKISHEYLLLARCTLREPQLGEEVVSVPSLQGSATQRGHSDCI